MTISGARFGDPSAVAVARDIRSELHTMIVNGNDGGLDALLERFSLTADERREAVFLSVELDQRECLRRLLMTDVRMSREDEAGLVALRNEAVERAAAKSFVGCIRMIESTTQSITTAAARGKAAITAAYTADLNLLRRLLDEGISETDQRMAVRAAAKGYGEGHCECMIELVRRRHLLPVDKNLVGKTIAERGSVEQLQTVLEEGALLDDDILAKTIMYSNNPEARLKVILAKCSLSPAARGKALIAAMRCQKASCAQLLLADAKENKKLSKEDRGQAAILAVSHQIQCLEPLVASGSISKQHRKELEALVAAVPPNSPYREYCQNVLKSSSCTIL